MRFGLLTGGCLLALVSLSSHADPVTYTVTADSAYGNFDMQVFSDEPYTATFTGDTANGFLNSFGNYENTPGVVQITLGGFGTFTVLDPVEFYVAYQGSAAVIGTPYNEDILGTTNDAFSDYTGATSIGPLSGHVVVGGYGFNTSGGLLEIDHIGNNTSTLTAVVETAATPEPSSFVLLGTGMLGLAGIVKRRLA